MTIKSVLLHLTNCASRANSVEAALSLATEYGAHVTAVFTIPPMKPSTSFMGYIPPEFVEQTLKQEQQDAKAAIAYFETLAQKVSISFETHIEEGLAVDVLCKYALANDIVVVSQMDSDDDTSAPYLYLNDELVVASPKPVLVVPYAGNYHDFAKHVLVGWSNTREASRALQYALPFLKKAEKVTLLSINPSRDQTNENTAIIDHLKRHDITADLKVGHWKDISVGSAILDSLVDLSADMVVMGAYGHSRIREMILGGTTKEILEQMTAPVVFAH